VSARNLFWSSADAIIELHEKRMVGGCPRCGNHGKDCAVLRMAQEVMLRKAAASPGVQ
jgi:sulfate permease, SulP family